MADNSLQLAKKQALKDIILKLHSGLSAADAKERFEKEVGDISSTEIAELEQALISEGLSTDEIKKFCNVHALLFQSALEKSVTEETFPSHPVYLFKLENREIEKLVNVLKETIEKRSSYQWVAFKEALKGLLQKLKGIEIHYERKEQVLFPHLEKKGFMGPSKVMWGKDNEVRDLLRSAAAGIESADSFEDFESLNKRAFLPLIEEVPGMIFKEEKILFPAAKEKLSAADWVDILRESDEIGYVFIQTPKETGALIKELKDALLEEPVFQKDAVSFPSGSIPLKELMCLFNSLPVDLTFVDKDDKVAYFSEGKSRIFSRPRSIVGRAVQNCHPPQSVDVVEKILASFKAGTKDVYEFWITVQGRFVHIRYFAVRDKERRYLGTLEVSQDITEIKKLEGQRRLLDEKG